MPVELNDSYEAIYRRAISQMAFGQTDQAIESLWRIVNRLTRLRPETLQRRETLQEILLATWESLVQFLRWEKRYQEAIRACEAVTKHLPLAQGAERRIASLMIERGDVEEGLVAMRQIAEGNPSFVSWADLGAEYAALLRYEQAESCYQSALALAKDNAEAAIANLGSFRVCRETDRADDALSAWGMAVVLDPEMGEHVSEVYTWLIERGDLELAEEYLGREQDQARHAFYQGLLDWQVGREDAAQSRWNDVLDMDIADQDIDAAVWIEAALRLGEPERAIESEPILTGENTVPSVDTATVLGIAYAMLDQIEDAKRWFDVVVQRLRRGWPATYKIEKHGWKLLNSLVPNQETVQVLADYFDTDSKGT